jgi:hypothetical protein
MHRRAIGIHGHCHRHVFHGEFINGFHAQVLEGHHAGCLDCLGHEIRGATHGHEIRGAMFADRLDPHRTTLGLAHHGDETGLL